MDIQSAKRRHHSLLSLQHLHPCGSDNEEPVLLSRTQQGSGVSSAESYFILQKDEERDGRDQDLCRDIMLSS